MKHRRFLLALAIVAAFSVPAPAGIFFGRHAKPNPAERVSHLLVTVRTDPDDAKRANAAKELRAFDPSAFPELVPILSDVLKHDQKAAVRVEAVQTLGKLRPISQEAGRALEEAVGDPSWRVRWEARQALRWYRISGYRSSPKPEEPGGKQGTDLVPAGPPVKPELFSPAPKAGPAIVPNETPPPPLADPPPAARSSGPVPKGSSTPAPAEMPKLQKPPPGPSEEGPDLPSLN